MKDVAKVFQTGRSQAVRLPAAFRFDSLEVYVRRDDATGDVVLSPRPTDWSRLMAAIARVQGEGADAPEPRQDTAPQLRALF